MFQIVYSGYWLRVSSDQNPIPKRVGKRSMCTQSTHLAPLPRNQQGTCVIVNYGSLFSFSPKI